MCITAYSSFTAASTELLECHHNKYSSVCSVWVWWQLCYLERGLDQPVHRDYLEHIHLLERCLDGKLISYTYLQLI